MENNNKIQVTRKELETIINHKQEINKLNNSIALFEETKMTKFALIPMGLKASPMPKVVISLSKIVELIQIQIEEEEKKIAHIGIELLD